MTQTHNERFNEFLEKDGTDPRDVERKALFYILSGNEDLYRKAHLIYDFEEHALVTHVTGYTEEELEGNRAMGEPWMDRCSYCELPLDEDEYNMCYRCESLPDFCGSSMKLVRLAFSLYNGFCADIASTFSGLYGDSFELAINALRIRYS